MFTASGTHDLETMDGKMVGKAMEPDAFALANEGKQGKEAKLRWGTLRDIEIVHVLALL